MLAATLIECAKDLTGKGTGARPYSALEILGEQLNELEGGELVMQKLQNGEPLSQEGKEALVKLLRGRLENSPIIASEGEAFAAYRMAFPNQFASHMSPEVGARCPCVFADLNDEKQLRIYFNPWIDGPNPIEAIDNQLIHFLNSSMMFEAVKQLRGNLDVTEPLTQKESLLVMRQAIQLLAELISPLGINEQYSIWCHSCISGTEADLGVVSLADFPNLKFEEAA